MSCFIYCYAEHHYIILNEKVRVKIRPNVFGICEEEREANIRLESYCWAGGKRSSLLSRIFGNDKKVYSVDTRLASLVKSSMTMLTFRDPTPKVTVKHFPLYKVPIS